MFPIKTLNGCKLCGGGHIGVIHHGTRDRSDIDVLKCADCGFVFLSKVVTGDEFYVDSKMRTSMDFEQWRKITYIDDHRRCEQHIDLIRGKTILDFGCGNGGFLMAAKDVAARAVGVELDSESVARLNGEDIECYENVSTLPVMKFDVIFMFHVIEHLIEPKPILDQLFDHLTDGGIIVMETPNADDILLSWYQCQAFADFTYWSPHIYLYNERTLKTMLNDADIEVVDMIQTQRYPIANHLRWLTSGRYVPHGGGAVGCKSLRLMN